MYEQIDWAKGHHQGKTFKVKQMPLEKVLQKSQVPVNFDLLVVDVEGFEYEVFKSFDLNIWKPKVMIVEIEDQHPSFEKFSNFTNSCKELRNYITNNGYLQFYVDEINTIFVSDEMKDGL